MRAEPMRGGKIHDSALIGAVLDYIANSVHGRDPVSLRRLGLRPDQLQAIRHMTMIERTQFALMCQGGHCVRVAVDPNAFDEMLQYIVQHKDQEALIHDCITADAPRAMMEAFFGLSKTEYARLRQLYAMPPCSGRTRQASPDEADAIHDALDVKDGKDSVEVLLRIAITASIPLRVVWQEIQDLKDLGTPMA